ncbi:hypothetical protein CcI156_01310 [Frankia sp. CcI156]|jgi:hypothetical protein|nr:MULTISPECIES: hypothetical protein [Frankia]ONH30135.1 hypothetical protein CcI156_01310 [Frankia sp. CcI156]ETA04499.1 hypothetical protein CcI6DRAFT_00275 [Frankia sp. CcI6]EYT92247.1 hypothetical protein ThrDRAFT_02027 [Frankia casuarinae]KDA40952.1 hypothetical protein BMG523Draft_04232 [Frankia sp. BMG5.23]KFB06455.1 hypothetical protein ALLO2DRAFT_00495 [Frankia sp. Allo2]
MRPTLRLIGDVHVHAAPATIDTTSIRAAVLAAGIDDVRLSGGGTAVTTAASACRRPSLSDGR